MPRSGTRKSAAAGASTAPPGRSGSLPDGETAPVAVAVTPGLSDGHLTEITGGDLTEGMLVITDQRTAASP